MTDIKHSVPEEVEGKVALVTGTASGIGKAIAQLLHARGAKVVAEDLNPDVEALAQPGLVPLVADITADGAAERAVELALERFGRLDILVNNAGIIINKPVIDMTREDWERIQATNVTAAFLHSREALKAMLPNKSGAIVNIASYASYFAFPTIAAYAASKGALAQLTRTLALERSSMASASTPSASATWSPISSTMLWTTAPDSSPSTARPPPSVAPRNRRRSPRWWPFSPRSAPASLWARWSWPTAA